MCLWVHDWLAIAMLSLGMWNMEHEELNEALIQSGMSDDQISQLMVTDIEFH